MLSLSPFILDHSKSASYSGHILYISKCVNSFLWFLLEHVYSSFILMCV